MHVYDHRRSQEFRQALEPAGALYDELVVSSEGYAGAVPIIHKSAVIQEIVQELDSAESGEDF